MPSRKAYRSIDVKDVALQSLLQRAAEDPCVGLDVSKHSVLAVLRWPDSSFERPWFVGQPQQLPLLVEHLRAIAAVHTLRIGIEPTGTYADPLRQALDHAALDVWRVSPKVAHDYAEVFDGTPSQHDGKDAAVLAELVALGKASPWPMAAPSNTEQRIRIRVQWLHMQQAQLAHWSNRLEALLARHWPEATRVLPLSSLTLLRLLARWGGPKPFAADADAPTLLARWGRSGLKSDKIERLYRGAHSSAGCVQQRADRALMAACAREALRAHRQVQQTRKRLRMLALGNEMVQRLSVVVGPVTACVVYACGPDPRVYDSAGAYRKALGLNLRERSSGTLRGQLHITKRGNPIVRQWLYYSAMRLVQKKLRSWYQDKKQAKGGRGKPVLVALMGKLACACYQVAVHQQVFTLERLVSLPGPAVQ